MSVLQLQGRVASYDDLVRHTYPGHDGKIASNITSPYLLWRSGSKHAINKKQNVSHFITIQQCIKTTLSLIEFHLLVGRLVVFSLALLGGLGSVLTIEDSTTILVELQLVDDAVRWVNWTVHGGPFERKGYHKWLILSLSERKMYRKYLKHRCVCDTIVCYTAEVKGKGNTGVLRPICGEGLTVRLLASDTLDVNHKLFAVHLNNLALATLVNSTDHGDLVILANRHGLDLRSGCTE